jgi:hypothetical protein
MKIAGYFQDSLIYSPNVPSRAAVPHRMVYTTALDGDTHVPLPPPRGSPRGQRLDLECGADGVHCTR